MDSLLTQAADASTTTFSILESTAVEKTVPNPDRTILAVIPEKSQELAVRTQLSPPQQLSNIVFLIKP